MLDNCFTQKSTFTVAMLAQVLGLRDPALLPPSAHHPTRVVIMALRELNELKILIEQTAGLAPNAAAIAEESVNYMKEATTLEEVDIHERTVLRSSRDAMIFGTKALRVSDVVMKSAISLMSKTEDMALIQKAISVTWDSEIAARTASRASAIAIAACEKAIAIHEAATSAPTAPVPTESAWASGEESALPSSNAGSVSKASCRAAHRRRNRRITASATALSSFSRSDEVSFEPCDSKNIGKNTRRRRNNVRKVGAVVLATA